MDTIDFEERFYNPDTVEELATAFVSIIDTVKYLYTLPKEHEDAHFLTDELLDAFQALADNCDDFTRAHDYYKKAELYTCATQDEINRKTAARMEAEKTRLGL